MRLACATLVALFACGCGLVANGITRRVPVRSQPAGAEVWVDGVYAGVTPIRVLLDPDGAHQIEVRLAGHAPEIVVVESHLSAIYLAADIVLTAGVGIVLDAISDGWDVPDPEVVHVALERLPPGSPMPPPRPARRAEPRVAPPVTEPEGTPPTPEGYGRHGT